MIADTKRASLANLTTWVFDLDGTLVEGDPYESLLEDVARISGESFPELMSYYRTHWNGLENAMNYHLGLVSCADAEAAIRQRYACFIRAKSHPDVLPGSREILRTLKAKGKRLICWTRGDEAKQRTVLRNSGLGRYFHLILVPGSKTPAIVEHMLMPHVRNTPFVIVGDSYEQDILPVLDKAAALFWIAGSNANQMTGADKHPPDPPVIRLERIEALYPYL